MSELRHRRAPCDLSKVYLNELASRVVAESGQSGDRFHLGKLILQSFRDAPEFTLQIDGATNECMTFRSALDRSTRCGTALRAAGICHGDVIILMAPSHIHLNVPFYAALYLGVAVSAIDSNFKVNELQNALSVSKPKAIFCQNERVSTVKDALHKSKLDARIITFDESDEGCSLQEFMEQYGGASSSTEFKAEDFDTEETVAILGATSGTTGLPKFAALTHKNFGLTAPYAWSVYDNFPSPTRLVLIISPLHWMTAILHYVALPMFRVTRLQSSVATTPALFKKLVKSYKPTWMISSPTMLIQAMRSKDPDEFDLSSFERVYLGGTAVPQTLLDELTHQCPNTEFYSGFGMTEAGSLVFLNSNPGKMSACGQPVGIFKYRIVNPETGKTVYEPNVPGELWIKSPAIFKEYYKNPQATKEAITEDGWFKTGDIFLREEDDTYYFVDRMKLLLKYNSYQISPAEVEGVILQHPAVQDTAVVGVPDATCGDLLVAYVVRRKGCDVTAQQIKDLVKENLADSKQLRGGVIFLDQLPMTATTKLDRRKLKELALTMPRE